MPESKLCGIRGKLQFEYRANEWMHSSLAIVNLTDNVVGYKISANHPNSFIVNPMLGQIYNKDTVKVRFDHKPLTQQEYQARHFEDEKFRDQIGREVRKGQREEIKTTIVEPLRKIQELVSKPSQQNLLDLSKIEDEIQAKQQELKIIREKNKKLEMYRAPRLMGKEQMVLLGILAFMVGFIY